MNKSRIIFALLFSGLMASCEVETDAKADQDNPGICVAPLDQIELEIDFISTDAPKWPVLIIDNEIVYDACNEISGDSSIFLKSYSTSQSLMTFNLELEPSESTSAEDDNRGAPKERIDIKLYSLNGCPDSISNKAPTLQSLDREVSWTRVDQETCPAIYKAKEFLTN